MASVPPCGWRRRGWAQRHWLCPPHAQVPPASAAATVVVTSLVSFKISCLSVQKHTDVAPTGGAGREGSGGRPLRREACNDRAGLCPYASAGRVMVAFCHMIYT
jgi:hypothetical protein